MRFFYIAILILFCSSILSAVNWEWAAGAGAGDLDRVWDMALDNAGNILVTGEFVDTLQIGDTVINGWGLSDIFVAKFSPDGIPLWAKAFGGTDSDIGISIDTDASGNCYVTGLYSGTAQFETQSYTSAGSWDIFILKLDADGNRIWSFSEGSPDGDIGYGIAAMPDGRFFVTGWFSGTLTFHDNTSFTSLGGYDIYTFACAADGSMFWKRQAGSAGVEYGYKIDADFMGNVYVTGVAGAGSDFNGILLQNNGAFIASYDNTGNIRWLNCAAGAGVNSIAVDRSPSMIEQFGCLAGRFTSTAQFGDITLESVAGSDDAYLAEFQLLTGSWGSPQSGGGTGSDKGRACAYKNHPYTTGSFEDTAALFGFNVTSVGASDGFILSSAASGNGWMLTQGGINNDTPVDIAVDNTGNVFVCGWFSGVANFGNNIVLNSGNDYDLDFFVAKINSSTPAEDDASPIALNMLKCYPNPFSDLLNISFKQNGNTSRTAHRISIYNIRGERVNSIDLNLTGTNLLQGVWEGCNFSGRKCAPGVYYLKANGATRKVLLLQ